MRFHGHLMRFRRTALTTFGGGKIAVRHRPAPITHATPLSTRLRTVRDRAFRVAAACVMEYSVTCRLFHDFSGHLQEKCVSSTVRSRDM